MNHYLITGGAGFIGANYAARLIRRGVPVTLLDNLSREGVAQNLLDLQKEFGAGAFEFRRTDIRDAKAVREAVDSVDVVIHLAAQVAVTHSIRDPRADFEQNALGTLNVLEAARCSAKQPVVLYASTNKVYGSLREVEMVEQEQRYAFARQHQGISEEQSLDFHSPYGCSKGTGDQYVRDYARIYGVPTVVLRQSCVYGPRQLGMSDQGWVAWFTRAAMQGRKITIYGNGKQTRDLLFIDDLLNAFDACLEHIDVVAGEVFNIGGGPSNVVSIWSEFRQLLSEHCPGPLLVEYAEARPGDQPLYISNIQKARRLLGWSPKISIAEGLAELVTWTARNLAQVDPSSSRFGDFPAAGVA